MNFPIQLRTVVTAIIFNEKGEILLQKRSDNKKWGLPGGGLNVGESILDAIKREVHEETGLLIKPIRLVGLYSDPSSQIIKYSDGRLIHCIAICFECKVVSGRLSKSSETEDLKYFDPHSLPSNTLSNQVIRIKDAICNKQEPIIR